MINKYHALSLTNQSLATRLAEYHTYIAARPPRALIPDASFYLYLAADFHRLMHLLGNQGTLPSYAKRITEKLADCVAWLSIIGHRAQTPIDEAFTKYLSDDSRVLASSDCLTALFESHADSLIDPHASSQSIAIHLGGVAFLLVSRVRRCDIDPRQALKEGLVHLKSDRLINAFLTATTAD